MPTKSKARKQTVHVTSQGYAHIKATFNNITISLTNDKHQVIAWSSAGKMGFRGAKKNTPYASQRAAQYAAKKAHTLGLRSLKEVRVKGAGAGREAAIRALHQEGIEVKCIKDVTPLPHNGCRAPQPRKP